MREVLESTAYQTLEFEGGEGTDQFEPMCLEETYRRLYFDYYGGLTVLEAGLCTDPWLQNPKMNTRFIIHRGADTLWQILRSPRISYMAPIGELSSAVLY